MHRAARATVGALCVLAGCGADLAQDADRILAPACEGTMRDGRGNVIIQGDGNVVRGARAGCDALQGDGMLADQVREPGAFDGLALGNQVVGVLARGPHGLRLHYDANLLPQLTTQVRGDTLTVANLDPARALLASSEAYVEITAPTLRRIDLADASRLSGAARGGDLTLTAQGSSLLNLTVAVDALLVAEAADAARAEVAGVARGVRVQASEAATVTSLLVVDEVEVVAEGAARVVVFAARAVRVRASGSAQVTVRGNPAARSVVREGAATVEFAN